RTPTRTRSCARGHHRQARLAGLGADQAGAAQRMPVHHHLPPRRAGPSLRRRRQAHPHDGLPRAEKTMTPVLRSYSQSTWQDGTGPIRPLADAATGETVALLPTTGPDPGAMLAHAREVGGPALRALTFTQRAAILKDLAKHLRGHVEEFAELSARTGATRRDTAVDVDGGVATLAVYASKAARELPDATLLPDGDAEPLGRGGTFAGRHVLAPRLGVAVQINAFNFPVWGMLEKFAPAFLAGMPSVVKPAAQTAYLTELVV